MNTTQPIPAIPTDVAPAQPVQSPAPVNAGASQASSAQADTDVDLRLVIVEDKAAGSYVYKTVDSRTGKVVSQMPREELLRMREASSYAPGSVVSSRS